MSGALPTWIERLLGIHAGPGEGTVWSLDHVWAWPPWLTLLFVGAAVAFVVLTYLRENPESPRWFRLLLAAVRLALVAVVLATLAQFALSLRRTGLPYVAVLVDDSLSMTIADPYEEPARGEILRRVGPSGDDALSRWNLARTILSENRGALLERLNKNYKLRFYYLTGVRPAASTRPEELLKEFSAAEPTGEASRLGAGVRTVLDDLRGSAPAALILLTDGINTDGPDLAEAATYARRRGVPLFTVGLGDDRPVRDVKLTDLLVEDLVFVDDLVYFECKLTAAGYQGRTVRIVLREKDKPDVLAQVSVTLAADGEPQQVRLPYRPTKEGDFHYVVKAEPLEGELETDNNRQERLVRVRKEKIKVLLAYAYPNFEYRYLRNMLLRDSTIELNTVLQDADPEHAEEGEGVLKSFPVRRDELFKYDAVILGDLNPALLDASMIQNVADFVNQPGKGGALICIAGPKYMPLAFRETPLGRLLPIDPASGRSPDPNQPAKEGFAIQPTDSGLASPPLQLGDTPAETAAIWKDLPPVYWTFDAREKPGARVLARFAPSGDKQGRQPPAIAMQYVGAGKVLFHATDETWRWRYRVGDVFFARYWIQTIRYLARSKLYEGGRTAVLTTDRREYRRGEPITLRLRFADERLAPAADDGATVVIEHQGHQTRRLRLRRTTADRGVFEAELANSAIGSYHAWVAAPAVEGSAPAADFSVVAPPGEFERVEMDSAELRRAAERTGGRSYTFLAAGRLLADLPAGRQVPIESLPPIPLWNRWPVLALFLVLLVGEWVLRKVGGMV